MALATSSNICSLLELSDKVNEQITLNLDTESLKAFRLTCSQFARIGHAEIVQRVPEVIVTEEKHGYPMPGTAVVHNLLGGLQHGMPTAAAKIKELRIDYFERPRQYLPPSLSGLSFRSLADLSLYGVVVHRKSLRKLLSAHRATLKVVSLMSVSLVMPNAAEASPFDRSLFWIKIIDQLRTRLQLKQVFLNGLSWDSSDDDLLTYQTSGLNNRQVDVLSIWDVGLAALSKEDVSFGLRLFISKVLRAHGV